MQSCGSSVVGHGATFPEQLANDHIISWSNEGDTVLDCLWVVAQREKWLCLTTVSLLELKKTRLILRLHKDRIAAI